MKSTIRFIGGVLSVSILTLSTVIQVSAAIVTPLATVQTTLTTVEKAQIDLAFSNRLDRQDNDTMDEKLEQLRVKLALALITYQRNSFLLGVLGYIETRVEDAEQDLADGMVDNDTDGDEDDDMDENDNDDTSDEADRGDTTPFTPQVAGFKNGPRIIVGGERSEAIAKREIVAQHEDIRIESIELTASDDIEDAIEKIYLFDEQGTFIGSARFEEDTAEIQGINYILEQGAMDFYAIVDTTLIGKGYTGPQRSEFTLQLRINEATGESSGKRITPSTYTNTTDRIYIAPVSITNIELTDRYESRQNDTRLADNTETDLALLVIETAETKNLRSDTATEANTKIHTLQFRVSDQTQAGNVANSLELERVDISSDPIAGDLDDGIVTFDLSDFDNEGDIIENGETAVFMIRGTVTLDDDEDDEFVEVELVDSEAGGIVYSSDSPSAPVFTSVYLDTTVSSVTVEE